MKDEIKDLILDCDTFKDVVAQVDDWIDYAISKPKGLICTILEFDTPLNKKF